MATYGFEIRNSSNNITYGNADRSASLVQTGTLSLTTITSESGGGYSGTSFAISVTGMTSSPASDGMHIYVCKYILGYAAIVDKIEVVDRTTGSFKFKYTGRNQNQSSGTFRYYVVRS